jgi:hypothetical protein
MKADRILRSLLLVLAVSVAAAGNQCDYKGCNWLATGVVTKALDTGFLVLAKDGLTYWIGTSKAEVVSDVPARGGPVQAGDIVRVFGTIAAPDAISGVRVRILPDTPIAAAGPGAAATRPEVRIIFEKPPDAGEVGAAQASHDTVPPNWDNRGLITEIDSGGGYIKLRTSLGQYTVSVFNARILDGARTVGMGRLSIGDSVRVVGFGGAGYTVDAVQVNITLPRWQADSAIPQLPVSVAGMIQNVDYPSLTFKMTMHGQVIQVSADKDTCVQSEKRKASFGELKPGMRVKMTGYGSPATGYAAQHIQIISVSL